MTLRPAEIEMLWGDGEHRFRLALGEWRELQEKVNAGPVELMRRVALGTWRVDDLREVLRIGLIGGGATPVEATLLVRRYVDERPLVENIKPASDILTASLTGSGDEAFPKADAQATDAPSRTERTASSDSPPSMDGVESSTSDQEPSTPSHSGSSPSSSTDTSEPTTVARTSRKRQPPKITTVLLNSIPPPGGSIEDALREAMKE